MLSAAVAQLCYGSRKAVIVPKTALDCVPAKCHLGSQEAGGLAP